MSSVTDFLRTVRQRDPLPEPPHEADPAQEVTTRWAELRAYAVGAYEYAQKVLAENNALLADNASMSREIERLTELNAGLIKDNRLVRAYATSVRTHVTIVREAAERLEREAMHEAQQAAMDEREETAEAPATIPHRAGGRIPTVSWGKASV